MIRLDRRGRPGRTRPWYRRGARGVAMLWFLLVALPAFFFGAGEATDFTTIIIAHRQLANATSAAAQAGAQDFVADTTHINPVMAAQDVRRTLCAAYDSHAITLSTVGTANFTCPSGTKIGVTITFSPTATAADEVNVTVSYQFNHLVFSGALGIADQGTVYTVTRSAAVCLPGAVTGPTAGNCVSPGL